MSAAVAYHSLVAFLVQNVNIAAGWYLYSVVAAEMALLGLGFREIFGRSWSAAALGAICLLVLTLDFYTVHFLLMPYYTGMIVHGASGALEAFHVQRLVREMTVMLERLPVNAPAWMRPPVAVLWAGYLCATAALATAVAFLAFTGRPKGNR
ncbi:MAG: hypothetical protein M3Z09_18385 [Acidobacteriota bacterium]|nr:hypothetical protein [Acidobacteriota bacterium]